MIKEIALDPMAAWEPRKLEREIRSCLLGPYSGKYLSAFPSDRWWQEYKERFSSTQPHLLGPLEEYWKNASHDFQRTFRNADDWCTNVHREQSLRPFASVGATTPNSFNYPSPDDKRFDDVLLAPPQGKSFHSTPRAFTDICSVLIARGPEIIINDPYLSKLDEQDHSNILRALLAATVNSKTTEFLVFTQTESDGRSADTVLSEFDSLITDSPRNCRVRVVLVKKNPPTPFNFHQRFLLTMHGGFTFDQGFGRHPKNYLNHAALTTEDRHDELVKAFISDRHKWAGSTIIKDRRWSKPKN